MAAEAFALQELGFRVTLVSAADSSKKSRDFITSNFEVQHLFQDVTMQMHGHHCERHAEGDSTCLRDMRSADVACCGTMCSPFSKQRPKRYQDGNVKAHRDYELSADIVFDWLRHLQPAAGIFENVLGWGHRLDSTHDETPLDEFMFLQKLETLEDDDCPGYRFFTVRMDLSVWVAMSRPRSFLRLQEPSERATPQKRKEVSGEKQTPTVGSRHWGLCQPFLNVGSILQKHISVLACKYFCAPTPSDQNTPEDMDKDKDVCNRLLFTPARPQSTLSSEAASLGVSRVTLREDLVATACAAWQAGCMSWSANLASVVRGIQDGKLHCVALLKQRLYDETPLKLRVPTDDNKFHQLGAKADSCVAKIMQTRYRIGVVVRDLATDQHIFVKGLVPTLLHALQRTRGQDICLSQQRVIESVPEVDQLASLCEPDGISVDITTADRYVANPAAEAALQQLRPEDCALHTDCEVHRLSTSINWSLEDVSHHVSGLIATSLVLRQAGCLARFRDHLCDEIESRLVITHGPPAGGREQAYREAVYAAFLGLDVCRPQDKKSLRSRTASQKAVLEYFMCGDLQGEAVQVFTRGLDATQPEVMALVKHAIIPALLPGSMPSYARHRWLGGELAVDYLGLLEGHNKLFSCTVRRMFAAGPQQQLPHSVPALTGWEALEDAIVQHAEAQDEDKGKDDKDQEAEEAAAKVMESELDPASVAEAGWVEFNKSMQDKMKRWALGYDLAMLSLMRCILGISARLMYRLLQRSSSNWDQEQQSKLLTAEGRSYRASEAFLKGDIEACFVQLHKAFHEELWSIFLEA
ncbi:unnamed protein product [Symbiodinium microadriaticum]|nr:unnamed protein product [Symbiodinium microadriaticum]CAE7253372.1 unnamed protein product [Symbiodinium sp. KB8]